MKFTITSHQVLYFYDEPLLLSSFSGKERFISLLVAPESWLSFLVSPENFENFSKGRVDLLSLMNLGSTLFGTFKTNFFEEDETYEVSPILRKDIPLTWLPGPNFKLRLTT